MYIYCISRKDDLELNLTFSDFLESQFANSHLTTIYRRVQNFDGENIDKFDKFSAIR